MRNGRYLFMLALLSGLFFSIRLIDWTPHLRLVELEDVDSRGPGVELRYPAITLQSPKAPIPTADVGLSVQARPPSVAHSISSDHANRTKKAGYVEFKTSLSYSGGAVNYEKGNETNIVGGNRTASTFNNLLNKQTNATAGNNSSLSNTLKRRMKVASLGIRTGSNNKTSEKTSVNGKTDEDDEKRQYRLQLQKANPLYSDKIINPHPYDFLKRSSACSQHAPDGKVFLLVLVACRPGEDKDRRWIRHTWGGIKTYRGEHILTRFLVNLPRTLRGRELISNESALYDDLIQENLYDTYRNMTFKVLMGMKWAAQMCPNASYVMNLDSDMFLNVFRLVGHLKEAHENQSNFAEGRLKGVTFPIRRRYSRWNTPIENYPESTYPPYLNGPAYVMSGDLPRMIFRESAHVRYLPWDDVYIGLVMKKLGVRLHYGYKYEQYPKAWNATYLLNYITSGTATCVGHQRSSSFVLRDIWGKFLHQYHNYTYSPPTDSMSWILKRR